MSKRNIYIWGISILCFVVLMVVTPVYPQDETYHDFADHRTFLGIPNMLNVVSNFPFLIVGLIGLVLCHHGNYFRLSLQGELWGWTCFFVGVAAVGFGSSYYHLKPNDATLVWDRLPVISFVDLFFAKYSLRFSKSVTITFAETEMTVAFTSIVAIFIIERVDEKKGTISIIPLMMLGIISILYWCYFDDLRPYGVVQFIPLIAIPAMTILMPPMYTHSTYWLWAAGFYLLAKLEEKEDKVIYRWTHHIISGHTLKHLFAAMVPVFLALMLAKREIEPQRQSLLTAWKVSYRRVQESRSNGERQEYNYTEVRTTEQ